MLPATNENVRIGNQIPNTIKLRNASGSVTDSKTLARMFWLF